MKLLNCLSLLILALSLASCGVVSTESYSCGLVPEIEVVTDDEEHKNTLCIYNLSGKRIRLVKLVFVEAAFDEAEKDTEPNWDEYENKLDSFIPDNDSAFCELNPRDNLTTLWVKVDTGDRHCVFAIVYEIGCCINVNIRKSDT